MPSRRSHSKSHHGCLQCKARRVKCDETLPECQRCVRRQMQCSFLEQAPSMAPTFVNHGIQSTSQQFREPLLKIEPASNIPTPTSLPDFSPGRSTISVPPSSKPFGLLEVELIHHYSTQTYITITSRLTSHLLWRDIIFREALRHPYLLDALMSISALHKAVNQPETSPAYTEYTSKAFTYQNAALAGYIPALNNPSKDNSIAIVAICILLPVWAFGSKRLPQGLSHTQDGWSSAPTAQAGGQESTPMMLDTIDLASVISVIQLVQGVHAVIERTRHWLMEELYELIKAPNDEDLPPNAPDVEVALQELSQKVEETCAKMDLPPEEMEERQQLYRERLQSLHLIARCRTILEWDAYIFAWPVTVKPLYINLLEQRDPIALALFVYWAGCLRCLDHLWWLRGWPYRLVMDVSSLLDDNTWSDVLQWPRNAIT